MPQYRVLVSARARSDLRAIAAFIGRDDPAAASGFVRKLRRCIQFLKTTPRLGRTVPELDDPTCRECIVYPYRIIYRFDSEKHRVEVLTVWHGARLLTLN
jgi:toxin ParE1/3/4